MSAPFASLAPPKDLVVDGQTVTIRKLSGLQFSRARSERPIDVSFRQAILRAGIVSWTFDTERSDAAIDDLDEDAAELIASEIIILTKPSLSQTAEESETARKNG